MPKSRISRTIVFLALLTVALVLAMASIGEPIGGEGDGGGIVFEGDGGALIIDVRPELHFGW